MKVQFVNAFCIPFAKGMLKTMVASTSPFAVFDCARMLRTRYLCQSPPPPPDFGHRASGRWQVTAQEVRPPHPSNHRLTGVLLAVALALLAGTAQAQTQFHDALHIPTPIDVPNALVAESYSHTLPAARGYAERGFKVYRLSPLPPGMNFDQRTRILSGTPTMVGTTRLTYRVDGQLFGQYFYDTATFDLVVHNTARVLQLSVYSIAGPYTRDDRIVVRVDFNQPVTVTGSPILELRLDTGLVRMSYVRFNDLNVMAPSVLFSYTVKSTDEDTTGISIGANALKLNGGSITDQVGNPVDLNLAGHTINITNDLFDPVHLVDGIPPQVTNLTFTTSPPDHIFAGYPAWYYWMDPDIKVRVDFAEPVTVTGAPILRLDIGERRVMARYDASVHNANDRSVGFAYQVQQGDLDRDGISIAADALVAVGTNTITDALGNRTDDTSLAGHAIHNDPDQRVDAVKPQISGLSIISRPVDGGTYRAGETIQLRVTFDEDLLIHPPSFEEFEPITLDSGVVMAEVTIDPQSHDVSGSIYPYHTINEMVLRYTVQAGDYDADGISYLGTPRNGRTIFLAATRFQDLATNLLNIDIPDLIITNAEGHKVDGGGPRVTRVAISRGSSPPNGPPYRAGEVISVSLYFNQTIVGDLDNLRLTLNLGSAAVVSQQPDFPPSSLNRYAFFTYTVQDGDLDQDGISIAADALSLTSGSVTNAAGTPLILSLAGHTITNDGEHKVDAAAPKVASLSIISTPADGEAYRVGERIRIQLTLDEPVMPFAQPTLSIPLLIGEVRRRLTHQVLSPSNVLIATYQVHGGLDEDGISVGQGGLEVTGGSLTDTVGNLLELSLAGHIITNDPEHKVGAVPRFTAADALPEQTYTVGQPVSLPLPQAIGGVAPLRYELRGDLPPGLAFDADTRILSGTPNAPVDAAELQLVVTDALPSFGILPPFRVTVVAAPSFGDASIDNQTYTVSATVTDLPLPAATSDLPLTYTLTPPPAGLAFDPDTRTLSGTPSAPTMPTKMALTATDSNGISTRLGFQVSVAERPTFGDTIIAGLALTAEMPPINILLPAATGGVAPLTHTLSQPPAGLFFDRSTRRLIGTPHDATEATMAYGATDSNGASVATNLTFSLSVAPPLRFVQTRIQDQIFTLGRPVLLTLPTATSGGRGDKQYTLNEDALPGWVKYDQTTHTLSGTPPAITKPILLRWQVSDVNRAMATLEFNFSVVNQPSFTGISVDEQIYTATAAIPDLLLPAPNHGARPLSYTLVPVPEGLSFDRETRTLSGTPTLPTAITELELTATGNNGASDRLRFRVTVAKPPRFVSEVEDMLIRAKRHTVPMILPHAEDGHGSFTYNLQERRDGSLRNLPEYTLFDPASRELKIYSKVRVYTLVYTATDSNGAVATQEFIVTATKPQLPPALGYIFDRGVPITPVVLPAATGGIGAVTYSFSGPTLGFKFDPDTRIMSGTPRIASADLPNTYFLYYYSAQDEAGGGGTTQLQIRVRENSVFPPYIPMFFDPPLSGDLLITRGIAFERVFPEPMGGTGANPLFNYSTHFESLPQGIQFRRNTRRLHGTAAQVTSGGGYPFRYTVADVGSVREQIVAHLKIKVVEQPSFDEPLRLSLRQNERLPDAPAEQITLPAAIDGAPPLVYTLEGGMPPGLAFDAATRALSGTPTEDGASTLIYTATDANGAVASGDFVFTVVDTVRPEVTGLAIISTPSRDTAPYDTAPQDTYLLGERIRMRLDFSEPVLVAADVSPKPILYLNLRIGSKDIPIQFHFPADSNAPVMALEGSYQVQEGDLDEDGISSSQLFLAGVPAAITDAAGNELDLHIPGLPTNPAHKVDGVVPKVSFVLVTRTPANHDTYRLGEEIRVLIIFDSFFPLGLGRSSLQLTLDSGVVTARNSMTHPGIAGGSGLDFSYVVQAGDGDENGISLGADALRLVAGESITDESGNPVNLSLAEFALTDDPRYKVDTAAPRVTAMSIISTPRLAGHYSAGERITARVDFNEPVTVVDGTTPVLQMSLGDDAPRLVAMEYEEVQAGDASLLFGYTVQAGDEDHNGIGIAADALEVTDGNLTDTIGNPAANLDLTAFAFENDSEHKVDGVGPQVTNVSITSRPEQFGYYVAGERITARVDFSESVTVADGTTPVLQMSLGDDAPRLVAMEYEEVQAGADSMLFGYTVQTGDEDNNGIGIGADALEVTGGSLTDTLGNPAADLGLTAFAIENDSEHKVDGVVPDITAPADMTFEATAVMTPLTADDYDSATSTDGTATISSNAPSVFPLGETPIIWTATDPAGNEMMATQVVTVVDTTPPDIALLGADPQTIEFGTAYTELNATATDEVDDDDELTRRIVIDANAVDTGTVGDYTVTYTVSDTATNAATPVTRMVTVTDTVIPDITAPLAMTFEATDTLTPLSRSDYGTATSGDDTADITDDAPDAFPLGATTITWTATDTNTLFSTAAQTITITDTTKPDITAPGNITEEATAPTTPVTVGLATATDLVTDPVIITRSPEGNAFAVGTHTITWKADDDNGNIITAEQTVTITDTTAPVIALLGDNPQTVEFGSIYNDPGATATDAVDDNDELTTQIAAASTVNTGTVGDYTVTYTVSDKATNAATPVLRTVTVTDTAAPDIIAPADITFEATDTLTPLGRTHYGTATSGDDTADITDDAPDAFPLGATTITWTATDKSANEMIATQVVTVVDTTAPDITAPGNIIKEATAPTTPVTVGLATATDLVTDPVIITRTPEADAFAVGTHTITWKADDGNGNTSTAAQTIAITDTTKPVITLTNDNADSNTVELGSAYTEHGATATDAVDDNTELTRRIAINAGAVDVNRLGTYPVTYDVSDAEGNNADRVTRTVMVTDTTEPDITAPLAMTFEATDTLTPLSRSDYGTATSGDDNADITDDAPDAFPLGATTITWTATDPATNEMMATQVVTIVDTTPPDIALLGADPQTVEFGSIYTDPGATATDAVDDNDELTTLIAAASTVDTGTVGDYTVTYTVSDKATNVATPVIRMVTVTDTEAPDIIAPADITFEATDTLTPLGRIHYGTATSTDREAMITDDAPDAFPLGATTITWTATDKSANEMIATQVVTIVDTTKPVIALLGADPQTVEFGSIYNDPGATATDAVDDNDELTTQIAAVSTVDTGTVGDYTVTYTVSDKATNAATPVIRMVTVTDTAAPDISPPADITFEATDTLTPLDRSDYGIATSGDDTADITDDAPDAFPLGATTITWTATDKSANEMIATQVVTVVDTTAPDITAPGNITEEATGPTTPVTVGLAIATDLVTDPVIITRSLEGNEFAVGTHTITWKADDGNGNIITAAQTITITDTTKPVIALLGDNPQTVEFGSTYNDPGATATDAVDDNTDLTTQIAAASTVNTGTVGDYTVTYTVSDKATNAATPVIRMVIVTDTAAPDITAPADITFEATDTLTPLGRTHYGTATSGDDTADITDDAPLAFSVGVHTITWTATDTNTLFSTAAQTITITDTTKPDITAPGNITKEATAPTTPVTVGQATATDLVTDPVIITRSPEGNEFAVGTHTITWKADDGNGNIITAAQTVTITDTTKPVIVLLGDNPQTVEFGSVYTDPGATATDAVDDNDELTTQIAAVSTVDTGTVGDYTVTYTVSDTATNAATPVLRTVIVTDTAAPDIIAPNTYITEATATLTPLDRSDYGIATSGDDTADITDDAPDAFPLGDTTITWTATDKSTNEMMDTQVVTVVDTTKPVIALNGLPEVRVEFGGSYTELQATATDAVDDDIQLTDKIVIAGTVDTNLAGIYHITYDVTDAAGNDAITVTRTVTLGAAQIVIDKVPPTIIAPSDVVVEATSPRTTVRVGQATATDNMDPMPAITRTPTGNEFVVGKHTITWTATDASDNSNSAEQTITITDTTKPVIALLGDNPQTVEFGSIYNDPGATATDAVDDNDELTTRIAAVSTVNTGTVGDYTITYTVSDKATNAATPVLRMVMVTDTTEPDISPPAAYTTEATATLTPLDRTHYGIATSGDDTADITDDAPDAFPLGATTITWTATDPATNEMIATQVVTIVDTTKPVIALLGTNPQTVEFGSIYNDPGATATDAVDDDDELTIRIAAVSTVDTGTVGDYTVTYTVSDKATNVATPVTRMVTVTDTVIPDITAPADITFEATDTLTPLNRTHYGIATSGDDTADITDDAPDAFPLGATTITWTATDKSNNEDRATQVVTVVDTTKPDITAPRNITKEATAPTTPVTVGLATATDLVTDPVIITRTPEADAFAVGTHTITWKADDDNGNIITAAQTITITDTTKPVIVLLGDNPQTVEFGSVYSDPGATATDAVDDNDELTTQIAAASTVNTGTVGDYTVTYTVSDKATNVATPVTRMVTVTDTAAPDITPPANITFEATDTLTPLGRSDYGTATSGDDTADITDDAPDAFPLGATTITWTATDPATNEMMATQVVTIVDTTKPVIALLGADPQTVEFGTTYTELNATATDEVDDDIKLTARIVADASTVNTGTVGDYTVTYTVSDKATNAATPVIRMVTVTDTEAPDISPPADITFEATDTLTSLGRTHYGTATSGDDTADITDDAPDAFPLGATTITWTATDPATNEMMATQVVTIVDTTPPVIALLGADPQTVEFGSIYNDPGATATDAVDDNDELTIRIAAASTVNTGTVGDYIVTYTVSDKATNAATPVLRMVTVTDTAAPSITAPADITFEATDTLTPLSRSDYGTATSGDDTADISDDAPDAFPLGDTPITWRATDTNSMFSTAEQTITITDTTKPVITLTNDNADSNTVELGSAYTEHGATATDAVDDNTELTRRIAINAGAVDVNRLGTYPVTYDVSDAEGNAADRVTRTVMVTDTTEPDITAPLAMTFEATDTLTPLNRTHYGIATSGDDTADITDDAPDAFPLGATTITWTATDKSNNEDRATQVVTVVDTTKPDITAPRNITKEATAPTTPVTVGLATATDLVTDPVIITRTPEADAFAVGTHTITWKADDDNGNIITAAQTITITDTTKPVIVLLGDNPQTVEFGSVYSDPGATATDAVDDNDELTTQIAAASTVNTGTVGDYTVTYTVSDKATNVATPVTRMVTVTDTAAPDIIAPNTYTTEATATLTPLDRADYGIATSTDGNADITDDAPDAFPLGDTTITWTATDKSTNEMMDTQVVTVVDTTKPDIAAPRNITKEATGPTTPVTVGQATATDLVTDPVIITRSPEGNEFAVGTHTITWKADDGNGNIITAEQTITITDTTKPSIVLLGDNPQTVEFGTAYTELNATATDEVDDDIKLTARIVADANAVDTGTVGDYTVTYTVSDKATNVATPVTRMVTVTDTTEPDITAPLAMTFEATDTLTPLSRSDYGTATSGDDTADITDDAPDAFPLGATTITWTATDKSTNEMIATQVVTIVDTTKPVIALLGADPQTVEFGTTYTELNATATDEVDDDDELTRRIVIDANAVDVDLIGTYAVTYDVTDAEGNAADRVTRMVTVTDTAAPDITAPAAYTTEATATLTPLSRSDYGTATSGDDTADITDDAPDAFPLGATTITWTATDPATNEMMATQVVTIVDTTPPDIALLGADPQTVEFGSIYNDPGATATDAVDDNDELTTQIAAASTVNTGTVGDYTVTYTVSDKATNAATPVIRIVTVTDTAAPDITAPADITFEATDTLTPLSRSDYGTATSGDDTADITDDAPDAFPLGETTITWTATDKSNNEMIATQMVTVEDTTAPMITMNGASPQTVKPGSTYSDPGATATDLVDNDAELTEKIVAVSTVDMGTVGQYTITYDVTDAEDNPADTVTRMVMVTNTPLDTTAPIITLLGDNPMTIEVGEDYMEPGATAFDRMDGDRTDQIMIDATEVDTNTVGTYTATYSVADLQDNQAQASRSVQVLASPDLADLNRVILSEVARTMADQNVGVVARRVEQAGQNVAHATSVGGQSNLANILAAQGRALADDQFNLKQLLAEAEFALPLSADAAPGVSVPTFWGTGDYRQIDSTDQLHWDGDFLSLHLGADAHMDDMVGGVALSWSRAELDYRNYHTPQTATHAGRNNASGEYEVDMTSVHPYMGWTSGQMDFWATLGYSDGKLKITDQGDDGKDMRRASSDLDLRTVAVGGSGPLLNDGATNLRVKTEALHSELIVAGDAQIAALSLTVSRLRLTLEATRNWALYNGAQLDLSWQGGLRYDGGAGNTGAGNEIGGGLRYVDAARGLTLEGKARGLVTDKGDTQEWGISGLIKFQGSPHGHGLSFSLTPEYGEADPDRQEFWQRDLREDDDDAEVAEASEYAARWDVRLGYGISGPGGHGLLTPYSEITLANNGNTYRLGLAWKLDSLFDVKLVTERRHSIDESEQRVILQGTITF